MKTNGERHELIMYMNWSTRFSLSVRTVAIGRLSCPATVSFDILQRYDFVRPRYSENQLGDINCRAVNRCADQNRSDSIIIANILMIARWQKIMRPETNARGEDDARINERGADVGKREETRKREREYTALGRRLLVFSRTDWRSFRNLNSARHP